MHASNVYAHWPALDIDIQIPGFTNRQIAARLHLTPGTVRNHLGRVFPKLDAADRTQAAVRAADLGLIDVDHEADSCIQRAS